MKYIIGYTFTVGIAPAGTKRGGSITQKLNKTIHTDETFKRGKTYKIYNIKSLKNNEGVLYTFISDIVKEVGAKPGDTMYEKFDIKFEGSHDADEKIDRLMGG